MAQWWHVRLASERLQAQLLAGLNLLLVLCSWVKPLPSHAPSQPRSKSGYLTQEGLCVWFVMCIKSCYCQAVCSLGSWDGLGRNRALWLGGNCVKSGEQCLCWIPDYKPPPLPLPCFSAGRRSRNFYGWEQAVGCEYQGQCIHPLYPRQTVATGAKPTALLAWI